ncbi:hypothetical protein V8F20_001266 [Naviculisporaceae sp. PSN 640]
MARSKNSRPRFGGKAPIYTAAHEERYQNIAMQERYLAKTVQHAQGLAKQITEQEIHRLQCEQKALQARKTASLGYKPTAAEIAKAESQVACLNDLSDLEDEDEPSPVQEQEPIEGVTSEVEDEVVSRDKADPKDIPQTVEEDMYIDEDSYASSSEFNQVEEMNIDSAPVAFSGEANQAEEDMEIDSAPIDSSGGARKFDRKTEVYHEFLAHLAKDDKVDGRVPIDEDFLASPHNLNAEQFPRIQDGEDTNINRTHIASLGKANRVSSKEWRQRSNNEFSRSPQQSSAASPDMNKQATAAEIPGCRPHVEIPKTKSLTSAEENGDYDESRRAKVVEQEARYPSMLRAPVMQPLFIPCLKNSAMEENARGEEAAAHHTPILRPPDMQPLLIPSLGSSAVQDNAGGEEATMPVQAQPEPVTGPVHSAVPEQVVPEQADSEEEWPVPVWPWRQEDSDMSDAASEVEDDSCARGGYTGICTQHDDLRAGRPHFCTGVPRMMAPMSRRARVFFGLPVPEEEPQAPAQNTEGEKRSKKRRRNCESDKGGRKAKEERKEKRKAEKERKEKRKGKAKKTRRARSPAAARRPAEAEAIDPQNTEE